MADMERIPPHNTEAEKSILGACMLDKDALFDALETVRPEDFYFKAHQEIFEAIKSLAEKSASVDILTVSEELKARGALDMVGGRAGVAELPDSVPSARNVGEYVKIVAQKAELRRLISAADDIIVKSYAEGIETPDMLDYAEQSIFSIAGSRQTKEMVELKDLLLENLEIINERAKNKGALTGVPTGLTDLDRKTSGLQKSDMIVLAARPSMGKTAFALTMARNAAGKGHSVLIFSLEMSKEQLTQRFMSMEAMVDAQKMRTGELQPEEWKALTKAGDTLHPLPITIDDTPGMSIMEMKNKCRRLKADKGLDLIIVDYLQLMEASGRAENRQQEISTLSRSLKQMARELDCPVVVLSQLSRAPDARTNDHRPILSDLRESGAIEQDADVVLFLYRDIVYNPETEVPTDCEVKVAKQRNGPTGVVEVTWLDSYTKFVSKNFGA